MKVFLPIVIKGVLDLWNEIMDAYSEHNQAQIEITKQQMEKLNNGN